MIRFGIDQLTEYVYDVYRVRTSNYNEKAYLHNAELIKAKTKNPKLNRGKRPRPIKPDLCKSDIKFLIDTLVDGILLYLKEGQSVNIPNLGTLKPRTQKERLETEVRMMGDREMIIPPSKAFSVIKFKATRALKEEIKALTYDNPFDTSYGFTEEELAEILNLGICDDDDLDDGDLDG